ncbi:MAG: calcium/sodium antiporter [Candidatus Moranbacteria bacterium]|jgi:cation:H+ antiporter|nr:calcium/sodium antiporter [Candidatus Moranbacteria bacterium]
MLTYILFVVGFYLLIKGADLLVDGAASVAQRLKISSIVIGLTIVAFGTSAPELVVNVLASFKGNADIAIGNILGSNIANILLILGISAMIYPLKTKENTVWKEIPLSLLAAILLGTMANDLRIDGVAYSGLTRTDGIALISFFAIFIYYTFGIAKVKDNFDAEVEIKNYSQLKAGVFIIMGIAGLVVGGKWIVDGATKIAELFNVSQSLIGLTVVAIGTSLPELATSAVAAYKKHTDIAIGNIVGSNIFNIFWILGISSIIRPLPFDTTFDFDIVVMVLASAILFFIMFVGKKHTITKREGFLMVSLYVFYLAFLLGKQ